MINNVFLTNCRTRLTLIGLLEGSWIICMNGSNFVNHNFFSNLVVTISLYKKTFSNKNIAKVKF